MNFEMVSRACPVCGSSEENRVFAEAAFDSSTLNSFAFSSRKLPEYMHYRLIECTGCDVLYASPLPTRESLERAYVEAAFDSGEEGRYASLGYAEFLPRILENIGQREAALDIGTGDGAFLEQLALHGFARVVGVEPSAAPVRASKPAIRPLIRQTPFRAADFDKQSFSLITCFQTMEHVYDPLALCREAFDLLEKGGGLFLVFHNRRALSARILGLKSPIFDIEHLQLFSPKSARHALERAGFENVEVHTVFNRYPLHYWVKLFPLPARLKAQVFPRLKRSRLGAVPVRLPAGNFAAVAYKC